MLTRVDVQSENPFFLEIRNAKPSDSIRVEKIEGLGPPDVDLFMGEYARDGGVYGGRRVPPRTVILTVSLNPNYGDLETVDGLRLLLYKTFMDPFVSTDGLIIELLDDTYNDRFIQCFTEKLDPDIFSDDTTAQITLRCPNPFIQDVALTVLPVSPAGPTFPFDYEGSVETGFIIKAILTSNSSVVTLDLNGITMRFDYSFLDDDLLIVNTIRGQRRVQRIRPKNISNRVLATNVATLTSAAHGYQIGDTVTITDVPTQTFYNGTFVITAVTTDTFSYALVHADSGTAASTGKVYEVTAVDGTNGIDTIDILYTLSASSIWLELHSLSNTLEIYGATDASIIANLTEVDFRGLHWGI